MSTLHYFTSHPYSEIRCRLWNYNPANGDEEGDDWNGENFSWFSRRRGLPASLLYFEQTAPTLDNGARILESIVRPYAAKTAGIPLRFDYEMTTGEFTYEWVNPDQSGSPTNGNASVSGPPLTGHPPLSARETEIFMPSALTCDRKIVVKGLGSEDSYLHDETRQSLFVLTQNTKPGTRHKITVSLQPPLRPAFEVNSFVGDYGPRIFAGLVVLFGVIAFKVLMMYT